MLTRDKEACGTPSPLPHLVLAVRWALILAALMRRQEGLSPKETHLLEGYSPRPEICLFCSQKCPKYPLQGLAQDGPFINTFRNQGNTVGHYNHSEGTGESPLGWLQGCNVATALSSRRLF